MVKLHYTGNLNYKEHVGSSDYETSDKQAKEDDTYFNRLVSDCATALNIYKNVAYCYTKEQLNAIKERCAFEITVKPIPNFGYELRRKRK